MNMLRGSILALCLFAAAMAKPTEEATAQAVRAVTDGTAEFSSNFYQAVAEEKSGNLVSSPLSAALVLSMAAYGARGNTFQQFKNVLHLPEEESVGTLGYQSVIDSLKNAKNVELNVANKAFVDQKFTMKPTFKELTETYFRSAGEPVNFAQPSEAANTINSWVQQNTNNKIKELFKASDLDPLTALVLANAVYFKGQWKRKFDPQATQDSPFHVDKDTVKNVPTMHIIKKFKYGEIPQLNATFVELPYEGDEFSMVIILPNKVDGLAEVEQNLKGKNIGDLLNGFKAEVTLSLPKFKIESDIDLENALQKIGLTDMFGNSADFSGISDEALKVGKAKQKAFIEVNEEGSEAAAATGLQIQFASLPISIDFKADHPFLFNIIKTTWNTTTNKDDIVTLFTGRVVDPKV